MHFYIVKFKEIDLNFENGVKVIHDVIDVIDLRDVIDEFIHEFEMFFSKSIYCKDDILLLRNVLSLHYKTKWGEPMSLFLFGKISDEIAEQIQKEVKILYIKYSLELV